MASVAIMPQRPRCRDRVRAELENAVIMTLIGLVIGGALGLLLALGVLA